MRVMLLFCLLLCASCQTVEQKPTIEVQQTEGCFASDFELRNDSLRWTDRDSRQLERSKAECNRRYGKCIKRFHKIDEGRFTVLCN